MKGTGARRSRKPSPRPCVFRESFVREQIDPRVKEIWEKATGQPAPFGRLRAAFQREHCSRINPYVGGECPYRTEECAMAFLSGVQNSTLPWIKDPASYFVRLVRGTGIDRADNKPLAREKHREAVTDQAPTETGSAAGRLARPVRRGSGKGPVRDVGGIRGPATSRRIVAEVPLDEEDHLRRARHRPEALGDLLGSLHLGSREDPAADEQKG